MFKHLDGPEHPIWIGDRVPKRILSDEQKARSAERARQWRKTHKEHSAAYFKKLRSENREAFKRKRKEKILEESRAGAIKDARMETGTSVSQTIPTKSAH